MLEIVQLIIIGIFLAGLGAMIVSRVRQRWLIRAILLWMFAPAIPIALILVLGTLGSPAPGSGAYNLAFGVVLIGAIILAPWIVVAGIGVAIGLKLRRKRPPEPPTSPAPSPSVQTAVIAPSPHFTQGSPDGVKEGVNAPTPGPFAAWRIALVILIGTLAAIAGLTYMSSCNLWLLPRAGCAAHTSGSRSLKEGSSHEALCRIRPVDGNDARLCGRC